MSSSGGEVKTQDGALALHVPSGALDHDVMVTVESTSAPAVGAVGTVFEIGPTGTQFKQPVTITLDYGDQSSTDLHVATYANGAWQVLPNYALDAAQHTISGDTMHLSPYALVRMSCAPAAASGACDSAGCAQATCDSMSCAAYPGAQLSCMEMPEGAAGSCCFVPGAASCGTRSVASVCGGTSGASAPSSGSGGAGSSTTGTSQPPTTADAGVPVSDALPPADMPKTDPTLDASVGSASTDGGVTLGGAQPSDAGATPQQPVDMTCSKPTCDNTPPCGGVPGAMRSACQNTDVGFEETCCLAADSGTDLPKASADGGVVFGSGGGTNTSSGGASGPVGAADAGAASDPSKPPPTAPDAGASGASSGSGGTSAGSLDASVPAPPAKG